MTYHGRQRQAIIADSHVWSREAVERLVMYCTA